MGSILLKPKCYGMILIGLKSLREPLTNQGFWSLVKSPINIGLRSLPIVVRTLGSFQSADPEARR